jgi:hypothetical protein
MYFHNRVTILIRSAILLGSGVFLMACESDLKNVRKLTETSFAPSGSVDSIHLKYTDSGRIKSVLKSPKMLDFSAISHPYTEFPKGIHLTLFD